MSGQKEPKLARARQIPEWDVYDKEIAAFMASVYGQDGVGSADDLVPEVVSREVGEEIGLAEDGAVGEERDEEARRIGDEL
jgi:UDP-glucose:glycoprotein glucosyltransferase